MRTVLAWWKDYEAKVVPKDAGPTQREECRRAFYAGAAAASEIQMSVAHLSDDAGVAVLEGLRQELLAFPATVRR